MRKVTEPCRLGGAPLRILLTSWPGTYANKNPLDIASLPSRGGAEIQLLHLARALSTRATVAYANLGELTAPVPDIIPFVAPRPDNALDLIDAYRDLVLAAVDELRPHVVLSYLLYPAGDVVAKLMRSDPCHNAISIGSICGSWEWLATLRTGRSPLPGSQAWLGHALRANDFFLARSRALACALAEHSDARIMRLRPIVEGFVGAAKPTSSELVLCFSRLAPPKRIDLVIAGFAESVNTGAIPVSSSLLIVGNGPLASELEDLAGTYRARGVSIDMKPGESAEGIFELLRRARVAIHASELEGYGTAPLECLATGTPTVLAGYDDIAADFRNERLLFPCALDSSSIAAALRDGWFAKPMRSERVIRMHDSDRIGETAFRLLQRVSRPS